MLQVISSLASGYLFLIHAFEMMAFFYFKYLQLFFSSLNGLWIFWMIQRKPQIYSEYFLEFVTYISDCHENRMSVFRKWNYHKKLFDQNHISRHGMHKIKQRVYHIQTIVICRFLFVSLNFNDIWELFEIQSKEMMDTICF